MKLQTNNIVELRNGKIGVVDSILGEPWLIVFSSFTLQVERFNEELKYKDDKYDVIRIYDGNGIDNVKDVWSKKLDTSKLNVIWEA